MSITTEDGYIASAKQQIPIVKTSARTSVALIPFSVFDLAGNPGAGTLAGTSTTAGVVPTSATAGCPTINAFGGSATGYLTRVDYSNTVLSRLYIYDMLFKAGAYAFNASQTLSSQPAYSSRCPDYPGSGSVFGNGTELWVECVTAFTGNPTITITYTNQAGTTGRTTGGFSIGAPTLGRLTQIPLQAGDSGISKIESVTCTVATVGTFNVLVLRPLWAQRVTVANGGAIDDIFKTGMPIVYATSALIVVPLADSTSTGLPDMILEIANN